MASSPNRTQIERTIARTWAIVLLLLVLGHPAMGMPRGDELQAQSEGKKPNKGLNAAIREAIFKNREELLKYPSTSNTRTVLCTPGANDSYELFQEAVREKLDILWDLDIYGSKYGKNGCRRRNVKRCAAQMEKYLDNFAMWQQLNRTIDGCRLALISDCISQNFTRLSMALKLGQLKSPPQLQQNYFRDYDPQVGSVESHRSLHRAYPNKTQGIRLQRRHNNLHGKSSPKELRAPSSPRVPSGRDDSRSADDLSDVRII